MVPLKQIKRKLSTLKCIGYRRNSTMTGPYRDRDLKIRENFQVISLIMYLGNLDYQTIFSNQGKEQNNEEISEINLKKLNIKSK